MISDHKFSADDTVWVVDGSHYLYRAFFAISGLVSPQGLPVNAIFGFLRMMIYLISHHHMRNALVAWDAKGPSWRKKEFEAYKAHREEMPEELVEQIPHLKDILDWMHVPQLTCEGYEADDVMFSVVTPLLNRFSQVVLVTNDKDLYQLIAPPKVLGFHPQLKVFIDAQFVMDRYGVRPDQMRDYLTLLGDASDGVAGVPGIGKKTAGALLTKFGTLRNLMDSLDEAQLRKPSKTFLKKQASEVWQSHKLVGLKEIPDFSLNGMDFKIKNAWDPKLWQKLDELGFKGIQEDLRALFPLKVESRIDSKTATDRQTVSLVAQDDGVLWMCSPSGEKNQVDGASLRARFQRDPQGRLLVYDVKRQLHRCPDLLQVLEYLDDVMLLTYLWHPGQFKYNDEAASGVVSHEWHDAFSSIKETHVFKEIEYPLLPVLFEMERRGIRISRQRVSDLKQTWTERLDRIQETVWEMAGVSFNILSPKQLGEVLFEKCGLPVTRKTKSGPSTDATTLQQLRGHHPIVEHVLAFKELAKLINTYTDSLVAHADEDDVLHTEFLQYGTASGRLSSRSPNLQNIPQKSQEASALRACFEPREGYAFVSLDYNQIELRILAHMSGEPALIESFRTGCDAHESTAVELFGSRALKNDDLRKIAKTINYAVLYGQTAYGLSRILGIDGHTAQAYIDRYFERLPRIKAFQNTIISQLVQTGKVETLFGRIRRFEPQDLDKRSRQYNHTLRAAFNMVLQGSAADLIKIAMLKTSQTAEAESAHLVLQVHDELVFEVPTGQLTTLVDRFKDEMETVVSLDVPLAVHVKHGVI